MERYKSLFEKEDLDELLGYLKGKYSSIKEVKACPRFKKLSDADKEYVIDELKADGWK